MTNPQRKTLAALVGAETTGDGILGTRKLAEVVTGFWNEYDRMHSILVRLEKRGLVERVPKPKGMGGFNALWRITDQGRAAL
jgi:DNA-binding MarR family transcriptional regulator